VKDLIKGILNGRKCSKCSRLPIPLDKGSGDIVKDFDICYTLSTGRPNTTGRYLFEVHDRVNSLKHTPAPVEDLMPTCKRMEEAWQALLGIYDLFTYIAKQRGALRLS